MIQLRVLFEDDARNIGIDYFPETMYVCQECGEVSTFFSISPKKCRKCKLLLPDLRQLKVSLQSRKNYYLSYAQYQE